MILFLVLLSIAIFMLWYWLNRRHVVKIGSKLPGPSGLPFIGNILTLWGKPEEVFYRLFRLAQTHTRMVALWIGPKLHVALFDPEDIEIVLRSGKQVDKADEYYLVEPWLGKSLLTCRGENLTTFRAHKKIILPYFQTNVIKNHLDIFNKNASQLTKILQNEIGKEEFDMHDYLSKCAMNILLETSMGVSKETLGQQATNYGRAVETLCKIIHIRMYTFWLRSDVLFYFSSLKKKQDECLRLVHSLTERVIQSRKKEFLLRKQHQSETGETEQPKSSIFLDVLIDGSINGNGMTDKDIKDEVLTIMFAGQDTTSGAIGFALSLLGCYREYQLKVQEELDEIFGDSNRPVTYDDIQRMEYTERVIQETLRLYPPIPLIGKKPKEDIKLNGYTLPKGCTIGLIFMQIHRNHKYYKNPHRFNPDNFLPENVKARHPYSFLPFSAGMRTCIGPKYAMLKAKVILAYILRNYTVTSTKRERQFVLSPQTTLKRKDGFLLKIEPRKDIPCLDQPLNNNEITEKCHIKNNIDLNGKQKLS